MTTNQEPSTNGTSTNGTSPTSRQAGQPTESPPVGRFGTLLLGTFLLILGGTLVATLFAVWPAVEQTAMTDTPADRGSVFGVSVTPGTALLVLVIVASALGSYVHAATSFADYVGNRRLARSWLWWYILRVFIGIALALIFYFAIRGGFFATQATNQAVNPFGIAALSGLVGLFAKQATDKLKEVFDTLFRTAPGYGDDQRKDSIDNPRPVVAGVEPPTLVAGLETVTLLRLHGEGFIQQSQVRIVRVDTGVALERTTTFANSTELMVQLLKEDLVEGAVLQITVFNPEPGGGTSTPVRVQVHPATVDTTAAGAGPEKRTAPPRAPGGGGQSRSFVRRRRGT